MTDFGIKQSCVGTIPSRDLMVVDLELLWELRLPSYMMDMTDRYLTGWVWAGNTLFQWVKQVTSHPGRTRNPMVIRWPEKSFLASFTDPNFKGRSEQYFEVFRNRSIYSDGWKANAQQTSPCRQDSAPGSWEQDEWELHHHSTSQQDLVTFRSSSFS